MPKTPDETKRELAGPLPIHFHKGDREARLTPCALRQLDFLHGDALDLVRQLEADNAQQARCIENLTDKLNATNEAIPRWISVEEGLPEDGQTVLFIPTCNSGSVYVGTLAHVGKQGGVMFNSKYARTTMNYYSRYWMPLPEPPKEE